MNYKVNWSAADGAFAVPDNVADNYIKLASGKAVKVLIYILEIMMYLLLLEVVLVDLQEVVQVVILVVEEVVVEVMI